MHTHHMHRYVNSLCLERERERVGQEREGQGKKVDKENEKKTGVNLEEEKWDRQRRRGKRGY